MSGSWQRVLSLALTNTTTKSAAAIETLQNGGIQRNTSNLLLPGISFTSVPEGYLVSAKDIGATQWECVTKVLLPLAMPRIMDAIIVGVSVSWTYITVAEYVNAQEGLGQLIANARRLSAMDQVFAGIIVIIAVALLTYQGLMWLKRRLYKWESKQ